MFTRNLVFKTFQNKNIDTAKPQNIKTTLDEIVLVIIFKKVKAKTTEKKQIGN